MVRILCGVGIHANHKVHVLGVVAQDHCHLCLAPAGIILAALCGILGGDQCSQLHGGVVPCAAPGIFAVILALAGALAVQVSGDLGPVRTAAGDLTLENGSAEADIVPAHGRIYAPLAAGLSGLTSVRGIHKGVQECLIGAVAGCQIQPASCPCLIVIVVIGIVEVGSHRALCLIGADGIVVQCLCIGQVFLVAEVDIVGCQCCGIFCCDVAGIIRSPVCSTQALVGLGFRRTPDIVVFLTLAHLIAETGNVIAVQLCACLEEITETVCERLQVCGLSQRVIAVLVLIVAPAQCGSGVACRQTELYVVACVVETAVYLIGSVAVISPCELRSTSHIAAAHISVVEIHGVLQQLCIVVVGCSRCGQRLHLHSHCGECRRSGQQRCSTCNTGKYPFTEPNFLHKNTPFAKNESDLSCPFRESDAPPVFPTSTKIRAASSPFHVWTRSNTHSITLVKKMQYFFLFTPNFYGNPTNCAHRFCAV